MLGYDPNMKVAVSIPDDVFRAAERVSRRLRVPRSQVYSRALETFLRQHSGEEVTVKLNAVVGRLGPRADPAWEGLGVEVLRRERW
jgi:hypothetical protein